MKLFRWAAILLSPFLLASCLITPGHFVSSLDIRKDRSFTFAYAGEVILLDPTTSITDAMGDGGNVQDSGEPPAPDDSETNLAEPAAVNPQIANQRKAVLEALSKEEGYRSVEYLGGNKFRVDYRIGGKLDRNFVYPLNIDAMAIIPWIAIELRKDGTARMMAIAFGDSNSMTGAAAAASGKPQMGSTEREGTFTLTTDASLVMQNNEAGMAPGPGTKVVWNITPTTKAVPTAVIRFAN